MIHFLRDEKRRRQRGRKDAQSQTLYLRLTDEQHLYSEVELCRGAGGRKSGQWIITVGSYTHAYNTHMHANARPHTQNHTMQHIATMANTNCMQIYTVFVPYHLSIQTRTCTHTSVNMYSPQELAQNRNAWKCDKCNNSSRRHISNMSFVCVSVSMCVFVCEWVWCDSRRMEGMMV